MEMDRENLRSMVLPQLREIAKGLGIKCSKCNKPVLIDRILERQGAVGEDLPVPKKKKSRSPKRKSRSPKRKSRSPKRKSRSPKKKSKSPARDDERVNLNKFKKPDLDRIAKEYGITNVRRKKKAELLEEILAVMPKVGRAPSPVEQEEIYVSPSPPKKRTKKRTKKRSKKKKTPSRELSSDEEMILSPIIKKRKKKRSKKKRSKSPSPSPLVSVSSSGRTSPLISSSPIPDQLCDFNGEYFCDDENVCLLDQDNLLQSKCVPQQEDVGITVIDGHQVVGSAEAIRKLKSHLDISDSEDSESGDDFPNVETSEDEEEDEELVGKVMRCLGLAPAGAV